MKGAARRSPTIDERADERQREALENLLRGGEGGPWGIFINTYELLDVIPAPISLSASSEHSGYKIGDYAELTMQPIRNPVTGAEVRASVVLPTGLVFNEGWCGCSTVFKVEGAVAYDHSGKQAEYAPFSYASAGLTANGHLLRTPRRAPRRGCRRSRRTRPCPATSGGEICTTGSPRSSARQMRPALEQPRRKEAAQERLALLVAEGLARLLVLDELERVEEPGPAQVADDRQVEQLRRASGGSSPAFSAHVLDDALAAHDLDVLERDRAMTGWPPNVIPCAYMPWPSRNGSIDASRAITAPIDA